MNPDQSDESPELYEKDDFVMLKDGRKAYITDLGDDGSSIEVRFKEGEREWVPIESVKERRDALLALFEDSVAEDKPPVLVGAEALKPKPPVTEETEEVTDDDFVEEKSDDHQRAA